MAAELYSPLLTAEDIDERSIKDHQTVPISIKRFAEIQGKQWTPGCHMREICGEPYRPVNQGYLWTGNYDGG